MKQFSETEISAIYKNFVNKDGRYYNKFMRLPLEKNNKNWKWEGKDFPRIWALLDLEEWLQKHELTKFTKLLSTCNTDPELEYMKYDKLTHIPYINGENDLHTLDLNEKDFDMVVFNQTIEHLYNPFMAMERLYAHTANGGHIFTSVPTINIPHMTPFHFNGMTPMGLCMLMMSVGYNVKEIGFWGNMDYINFIFQNQTWPDYRQLMKDGIIRNEMNRNVQCWILAQKS